MIEGKIVHLLTGKNSLKDVSVDELKNMASQQPYFSIIQLLLAKKMKQESHPEYNQQLQKTALYFPNAHWLQYQLNDVPENELAIDSNLKNQIPIATTDITLLEPISIQKDDTEIKSQEENPTINKVDISTIDQSINVVDEEQPINLAPSEIWHHDLNVEKEDFIQNEINISTSKTTTDTIQHPLHLQSETLSENRDIVNQQESEAFVNQTTTPSTAEPGFLQEKDTIEESEENNKDNVEEIEQPVPSKEDQFSNMKLAELLQEQAEAFNKPVEPDATLAIETEPYHTVDYFASQGIQLNLEQQQQDKLGKQVRKFTDWLRQTKRINTKITDLGTSPELEHIVQDIAANSNEAREIVTEAMAEVLIKQGKTDKAIQLYIKLSFLNPDKSAYFADKIQALKEL